jgi:hypothetical protein
MTQKSFEWNLISSLGGISWNTALGGYQAVYLGLSSKRYSSIETARKQLPILKQKYIELTMKEFPNLVISKFEHICMSCKAHSFIDIDETAYCENCNTEMIPAYNGEVIERLKDRKIKYR